MIIFYFFYDENKIYNYTLFLFLPFFALKEFKIPFFVVTDEFETGVPRDFLWIRGNEMNPSESILLFNEFWNEKGKQPNRRVWFAPGNLKLVEKLDENDDEFWETTIYFNKFAMPKMLSGIIARIEYDLNADKLIDVWIFPGERIEWSTDPAKEIPGRFVLLNTIANQDLALEFFRKKKFLFLESAMR
ncbi:hypothetical protein [Leptospira ilyithenensis]|uniref:Uncharacterized protein n=1 Tax=Leptospira ilyithenensis TaxID=2484901 RepID=A0A4R9LNX1_9LEPT|nr:hypothetical protein [Leptospira ilyithenensis]TGN10465.1 hypothetical protein EHS11_09245 [Leptospira ilyithenensis]